MALRPPAYDPRRVLYGPPMGPPQDDPDTSGGGMEPVPPGFVRIQTGVKREYDLDTGKQITVPVYDVQRDPTFRLPPQPSVRAPRDPLAIAMDQLQYDQAVARAADYPEDRQMQRDIGYGNLDLARGRLGLDTAFGNRDRDFRDAVQQWTEATNNRDFEAAQKWKEKAYGLDERAAARADAQLGLSAELGYANSRREDAGVQIARANVFGRDVGGELTGTAGTLTSGEQQRRFQNANMLGQQTQAQGNLEEQRRMQASQWMAGQQLAAQQQAMQEQGMADQQRTGDLNRMLQMANQRAQPRVMNTVMAAPGRRFG